MSLKVWNFSDPDNIFEGELSIYKQLMGNKLYLEQEKLRINTLKTQNDISLINIKRNLYRNTLLGINPMVSLCEGANNWLGKLERKEVRKNAKNDDDKVSYNMLVNTIEMATGIKVKEITKIIFYGYKWTCHIRFIDRKYGKELELHIPNLKNSERFAPNICNVLSGEFNEYAGRGKKIDVNEVLKDLETVLYFVEEEKPGFTKYGLIASFPGVVEKLELFSEKLDVKFGEVEEEKKEDVKDGYYKV